MNQKIDDLEKIGMSSKRLSNLRSIANTWINPELHQSITMLVMRNGSIVFHETVGHQNPEPDSPTTPLDALYPVASFSKVITATAIMTMVEDGLLSLHNPVSDFIPEFSGENKSKVLLWHLLTHTMGGFTMAEVDDLPYKLRDRIKDLPPTPEGQHPQVHQFLELGYGFPLQTEPGTVVGYSNYGFELLGEVIRRVNGIPLAVYADERLFKPLQMNDTHFILPKDKRDRLVRRPKHAVYADAEEYFFSGLDSEALFNTPWASAGVCSTALDLAKFAQVFLNGGSLGDVRILSPTTVKYMQLNQTPGLPDADGNEELLDGSRGIGWDIPGTKKDLKYASLYSPSTVCHSGAGGSLVWVDPEYDLVGVFLSVELGIRSDFQRNWTGDRFANAVTASITQI